MKDEQDLVEDARRGSREAFGLLVEEIQEPLRSAIARMIGPHLRGTVEPEDVFQDTLARAYQSMNRYRWGGEGTFLRWLCGIAEHFVLAAADKRRRRSVLELRRPARAASEVSPSRGILREERFDRLQKALESLSPDHRQVILLARIEGLQIQAIAQRMGRSTNAVKNLLLRALKELKRSFGDTGSFRLPDRRLDPEGEHHGK